MMKRLEWVRFCSALFILIPLPRDARADGGILRLREAKGPFIVTIFTSSEVIEDSPADVSVMVQQRDSSEAILDADVNLVFTAPASLAAESVDAVCSQAAEGDLPQFSVLATRKQASNKLLYAAPIKFNAVGNWQLRAIIKCDGDSVKIACSLPVSPPPHKLSGLFPYLILPPLLVVLFALNQWLRGQSCEKLPPPLAQSARPPC